LNLVTDPPLAVVADIPGDRDDKRIVAAGIKAEARRLGLELAGIAPAVTPTGLHEFLDWLERGHAGEMHYFERREEAYGHPRHVLDGVRSVVMLGINYNNEAPQRHEERRREETSSAEADRGAAIAVAPAVKARIARYAQGSADYHDVIREKLRELARFLSREAPGCRVRGVVDTAPLLERDFARLAGLGWFGKNTMLINKHLGSWFFLAALLVDVELEYDAPHAASHCGTCTRCLDACPTGAFVEPYVLDARRCISYLTIEHRGAIPEELRPGMGDWLFGCDICQEVCPWNRKAPLSREPAFAPRPDLTGADAAALLSLTEDEFRRQFGSTALARPGRAGLVRNAAIVAGISGNSMARAPLADALDDDAEVVRDAARWALERMDRGISGAH
jgi:epoxyqueuosine reductase